jgi:murein DD-endopeptidase MepM/ murein hydrolase activator NlpD
MARAPWLALLLFVALAASGRDASARARGDAFLPGEDNMDETPTTPDPQNWILPMPALDGRPPTISSGWGSPRPAHGGEPAHFHQGADFMYDRVPPLPHGVKPPLHEHRAFFVPEGTHALAARAGKVWSVEHTSMGWRVVVDHGAPWATVYQHLARVYLPPHRHGKQANGQPALTVEIGEPLGDVGYDPSDPEGLRHLHFELWHGNGPVNPEPSTKNWRVLR